MKSMSEKAKYTIVMILACLIFGSIGTVTKLITFPVEALAFVRAIFGSILLLLFLLVRGKKPNFKGIRKNIWFLMIGGFSMGLNWIFLFKNFAENSVATSSLLNYMAPILVIISSPIIFKEKIRPIQCIFIAVTIAGVMMVSGILSGEIDFNNGGLSMILLGIASALTYAILVIISKFVKGISGTESGMVELFFSSLLILPYAIFTGGFKEMFDSMNLKNALLTYVSVFLQTGVVYALYFTAVQHLEAKTLSLLSYIDPVVSVILAILILKEPFDLWKIVGAVLVIGGIILTELTGVKKVQTESKESEIRS